MLIYAHTKIQKLLFASWITILSSTLLVSCGDDDTAETVTPPPVNSISYPLTEMNSSGIAGSITFQEQADGALVAKVALTGPATDDTYPVSINANSAAEGSSNVAIDLQNVDGATLQSTTPIADLTYEDLLTYDGYLNVQRSTSDLTIVAQADIGGNALTGNSKQYALGAKAGSGITGTVLWEERVNGHTKATITLENFSGSEAFPSHIHVNSAAEGGGIFIDFNSINGSTGKSITTIRQFNETVGGEPVTYEQLLNFDGYINVHRSAENPVVISQTDIGANELTGNSVTYPLDPVAFPDISGSATFAERKGGETLVTLTLDSTAVDGPYPAQIYSNTAAEGGRIVIDLSSVDGATGTSATHVTSFNDGTPVSYESLTRYDGYINVRQSEEEINTLVAQGDIGGNALTGESVAYALTSVADPAIQGEATFYQRNNGLTLAVVSLEGTPEGGIHPMHIHANTAAEIGPIAISLNPVDGTSGLSKNSIRQFNDGTAVTYEQLLTYDGYLDVHLSDAEINTLIVQSDIGQNALTGNQVVYPLAALSDSGISGTATFAERNNGFSLVTLAVTGTSPEGSHPAHIHFNSAAEGGSIAISLTYVNGATGLSQTNIKSRDNNLGITYAELIDFDGYINIHLSTEALNVIVSQGNVGSNAPQ